MLFGGSGSSGQLVLHDKSGLLPGDGEEEIPRGVGSTVRSQGLAGKDLGFCSQRGPGQCVCLLGLHNSATDEKFVISRFWRPEVSAPSFGRLDFF